MNTKTIEEKSTNNQPIRLIAVNADEVLVYGLTLAAQNTGSIQILGNIDLEDEPVARYFSDADVILIQISSLKPNGFELGYRLGKQYPDQAILIMSDRDLDLFYVAAFAINARGLLVYHDSVNSLINKILRASEGPIFTNLQLQQIENWKFTVGEKLRTLSQREWVIFRLVVEGCKNREISDRLEVSKNTVERHLSNLMDKLQARSRTKLLDFYYRNHLNEFKVLMEDKSLRTHLFDPVDNEEISI